MSTREDLYTIQAYKGSVIEAGKVGVEAKVTAGKEKENPIKRGGDYHHIRIKDPKLYSKNSFRFITFDKGIRATIGCKKGYFRKGKCTIGTEVQSLLFPKDKYTKEGALEWVKKHPKIKLKKKK